MKVNYKQLFILPVLFIIVFFIMRSLPAQKLAGDLFSGSPIVPFHSPLSPFQSPPVARAADSQSAIKAILAKKGSVVGHFTPSVDWNGVMIYLGQMRMKNNVNLAVKTDDSPEGKVLPNEGYFYFENIPPGRYALILSEPELGGKVWQTTKGEIFVIDLAANPSVDMGMILSPFPTK